MVGAELERALYEEKGGLWFWSWLAELLAAANARTQSDVDGDGRSAFLLLQGLASVATPGIASTALAAV